MAFEVDLSAGIRLNQESINFNTKIELINRLNSEIQDNLQAMELCKQERAANQVRLASGGGTLKEFDKLRQRSKQLYNILETINEPATAATISVSSTDLGQNIAHPAQDCLYIKQKYPNITNGFYWIHHTCSNKPMRVFCDLNLGTSIFVPPDAGKIKTASDCAKLCAQYGLSPLQIKNKPQLDIIWHMLMIMGANLEMPVPFAIKGADQKFYDLGFKRSVSEDISGSIDTSVNVLGIGKRGLVGFNGEIVDMSSILCSTNVDALNHINILELNCETTALVAIPNTSTDQNHFRARCPMDCSNMNPSVYGTDIYSQNSQICPAAIHAGKLQHGGLIEIILIPAPSKFVGSKQNGVVSDDYEVETKRLLAFQIKEIDEQCPNVSAAS